MEFWPFWVQQGLTSLDINILLLQAITHSPVAIGAEKRLLKAHCMLL